MVDFNFDLIKNIPNQRNYITTNISHINLVSNSVVFDLVLYIDARKTFSKLYWTHKSDILDKWYFSFVEGSLLQNGFYKTLSKNQNFINKNIT